MKLNRWQIDIEAAEFRTEEIWLYVSTGGMSGGLFITPAQARELASELVAAADETDERKKQGVLA